jgi:putative phosphotransacetylase
MSYHDGFSPMTASPSRAHVEQLVRQAVYARVGRTSQTPARSGAEGPNPLVVNVSARHCHVSEEALEALFGKGAKLTVLRDLYQKGHFAANEMVTIIGPRSRMISNLRILGPCRPATQVELSYSDGIALGFDLPHRISGDIKGTQSAMLMGPAGFFEMKEGVIRAMRHVHMSPADAEYYGVNAGDLLKLRVGGDAPLTLDRVVARVDPATRLEVHIDTDEGNACNLRPDTECELFT